MGELYVYDPSGSLVKFGQVTDRLIQTDAVQEAPSAYMDLHISAAVMLQRACGRRLETTGRL